MTYNVIISSDAEEDFENILKYLLFEKRSRQAAEHFIDDFENTKNRLSSSAMALKLCTNPNLRKTNHEPYFRFTFSNAFLY